MKGSTPSKLAGFFLAAALAAASAVVWAWPGAANPSPRESEKAPDGWTTAAPRDEIRPAFTYDATGGPDGKGCFVITADRRDGLDGCWTKSFPVTGGKHYRFAASFRAKGVTVPRRTVVVEIHWRDAQGK